MNGSSGSTFSDLGLRASILKVLSDLGYEMPTPIQARTIPALMAGEDVIGQAQTGTGKTAAFALPMLEKIDLNQNETQALVLTPTRELAMQVSEAIHSYSRGIGQVSVLPVYGGAPIVVQLKRLARGVHIVVGTPGRLIDHLDRGTLRLDSIRMLVLDEADEMLKMGFIEEVERILSLTPSTRQVALFSATMPAEVIRIAQRHLKNPRKVEIEHHAMNTPAIQQRFLNLSEGQKLDVLTGILEIEENEAVLIFRRTKNGAGELAEKLQARGFAAEAMHGDMTQSLRESVIRKVKGGQIDIVVATDVAARGLDLEQISHVINYDVPNDVEVYVHRIGRTGRAGRSGVATLFITPRERRMMRDIERFTGTVIKPMKMPTGADVSARRIATFKESLRKNLQEGDLDLYVELVEQLADEGSFDLAEVAAAAARMANGSRSLAPEPDRAAPQEWPQAKRDTRPQSSGPRSAGPRESGTRPPFDASRSASSRTEDRRPRSRGDFEPKVRLSMAVGKKDGIRAADIVGSIANEADVPGRDIGPIDIRDDMTIVVIPERYREQVLTKVATAKFRGRPLNIRVAEQAAGGPSAAVRRTEAKESAPPAPRSRFSEQASSGRFSRDDRPPRAGKASRPPFKKDAGKSGSGRAYVGSKSSPADRYSGKASGAKSFDKRGPGGKKKHK